MTPQEIFDRLKEKFGNRVLDLTENVDPFIRVSADAIAEIGLYLRDDEAMGFESLMCLSGVDYPEHLSLVYHLFSSAHRHKITLKTDLGREDPSLPTVEGVWRVANWHERETYDMFGVVFEGHSDLRRILMPEDWEGYPLRKDYKDPDFYRGMRVPY